MEVQYDQEPFARPRYRDIVTEARHEEQRGETKRLEVSWLRTKEASNWKRTWSLSFLTATDTRNLRRCGRYS